MKKRTEQCPMRMSSMVNSTPNCVFIISHLVADGKERVMFVHAEVTYGFNLPQDYDELMQFEAN